MATLSRILDTLEAHCGPQSPNWPTDPYLFLVWWYCGYPASDAACAKGWASLKKSVGVEPDRLLASEAGQLALALKPGGMFPEQRAMRLKEVADRNSAEYGGAMETALKQLPLTKARAALKKFAGIGDPGADRILLFGNIAPLAAVPSNCTHVTTRLFQGKAPDNYNRDYADAQMRIDSEIPATFEARTRAYLLLKAHGQQLCRRSSPQCGVCPIALLCKFAKPKSKIRTV